MKEKMLGWLQKNKPRSAPTERELYRALRLTRKGLGGKEYIPTGSAFATAVADSFHVGILRDDPYIASTTIAQRVTDAFFPEGKGAFRPDPILLKERLVSLAAEAIPILKKEYPYVEKEEQDVLNIRSYRA